MQKQSLLTVISILFLSGCDLSAPPCPFKGAPAFAPSAGCMVLDGTSMLVVENFEGKLSPPGGMSREQEPAQCTAFRETWEETGLAIMPQEHLATFDTGFHVYRCDLHAESGDINPPLRLEVERAFYLPLEEFESRNWRFPGQDQQLIELARELLKSEDRLQSKPADST